MNLRPSERAVLDALAGGPLTPGDLRAQLPHHVSGTVRQARMNLLTRGLVVSSGSGRCASWSLTADGRNALAHPPPETSPDPLRNVSGNVSGPSETSPETSETSPETLAPRARGTEAAVVGRSSFVVKPTTATTSKRAAASSTTRARKETSPETFLTPNVSGNVSGDGSVLALASLLAEAHALIRDLVGDNRALVDEVIGLVERPVLSAPVSLPTSPPDVHRDARPANVPAPRPAPPVAEVASTWAEPAGPRKPIAWGDPEDLETLDRYTRIAVQTGRSDMEIEADLASFRNHQPHRVRAAVLDLEGKVAAGKLRKTPRALVSFLLGDATFGLGQPPSWRVVDEERAKANRDPDEVERERREKRRKEIEAANEAMAEQLLHETRHMATRKDPDERDD